MIHRDPIRHELKTWPDPFRAVWERRKTAEFRRDDRGFGVGHELLLREYDPGTGAYSGRQVAATITDVRKGGQFGIPEGYAMISFRPEWRGDSEDQFPC